MTFRCVVWQAIGYYVPLPFWLTVMVLQTLSIALVISTMRSSGGDFSDVALRVCSRVVVVTLVLLISPGVALVLYWVVVPSTRPASNDAFTQPAILAGRLVEAVAPCLREHLACTSIALHIRSHSRTLIAATTELSRDARTVPMILRETLAKPAHASHTENQLRRD